MVSPWMDYNITEYLREDLQANPLKLVRDTTYPDQNPIESGSQLEDAARGLQYLHSVELAHGDLKGVRLLISFFPNDSAQVRAGEYYGFRGRSCLFDGRWIHEDRGRP